VNLHNIAAPYIATVKPLMLVTLQVSTGSVVQPDGSRAPGYADPIQVWADVQALTYQDMIREESDGLIIQGQKLSFILNGNIEGLIRAQNRGGDLITLPDGTVWQVSLVVEHWNEPGAEWTKLVATMQNVPPTS
jgi:hypothetical protein